MNKKNQLIGVLLAAGKGLRAYPSTKFVPKPLFKIHGKTILSYNLDILINTFKVKEIYIVVGYLGDKIIKYIEKQNLKIKITFIKQKKIDGIANALLLLKNYLKNQKSILILADEYYHSPDYKNFLSKINENYSAVLSFKKENNPKIISKNFIGTFENSKVIELFEKPSNPNTNIMGLGTYFFNDNIFKYIDNTNFSKIRNEREITDVFSNFAKNENVGYSLIDCEYFNISTRSDIINANYFIRAQNFNEKKLSLVIPAYNEEVSIAEVIDDYRSYDIFDEIIVVDNNSKDNTLAISKKSGVKVLEEKKQGYGNSLMTGMKAATGDIIFLTEADGSFKGVDLEKFLAYLKEADMVIGTRTTKQMIEQGSNMDSITRWANVFFAKFVQLLWQQSDTNTPRFTDVGCTYRAIWRTSFNEIEDLMSAPGPEFSLEMMLASLKCRQRIIEVPISYFNRIGGISKHSANYIAKAKTALKMLLITFKVKFLNYWS